MSAGLPAPRRIDIRSMRERFNLTQADIADELHVDERTVRRWESGRSSPSPMAMAHMRSMQRRMSEMPMDGESMEQHREAGGLPRRRLPSV